MALIPQKPPASKPLRILPVIGWREWVGLDEFNVPRIKAKIDTGARTSAIHAFRVRPFSESGVPHVSFMLHPEQRRRTPEIECICAVHDRRKVRSSNGQQELRYVVRTTARIGEFEWPIELTLADRDQLGFRMLLGRQAMRQHFVIDPGRSFVGGRTGAQMPLHKTRKKTPE
ncbi:RimK/LysX family protein [Pyruvatibacter sp.]|uniref:ATP-dependent zinc protease family protein n=1 Tax=Pyruvatibacter sp. TaxID=1981328 RepID=UPI0032EF2D27